MCLLFVSSLLAIISSYSPHMPNVPQRHLWHIGEKVTIGNLLYNENQLYDEVIFETWLHHDL